MNGWERRDLFALAGYRWPDIGFQTYLKRISLFSFEFNFNWNDSGVEVVRVAFRFANVTDSRSVIPQRKMNRLFFVYRDFRRACSHVLPRNRVKGKCGKKLEEWISTPLIATVISALLIFINRTSPQRLRWKTWTVFRWFQSIYRGFLLIAPTNHPCLHLIRYLKYRRSVCDVVPWITKRKFLRLVHISYTHKLLSDPRKSE